MYRATGLPGWARFAPSFGPGGAAPGYGAGISKVEEMEALKQQADYFKAGLEDIEKRLQTLESSDK